MADFTVSRVAPASGCPEHSTIQNSRTAWFHMLNLHEMLRVSGPAIVALHLRPTSCHFVVLGNDSALVFVSWVDELRPSLHLLSSCTKLDCL